MLEYRERAVWGNPYLRVLRSPLEQYIAEELGEEHRSDGKKKMELRKIKSRIAKLKTELAELETRNTQLESKSGK